MVISYGSPDAQNNRWKGLKESLKSKVFASLRYSIFLSIEIKNSQYCFEILILSSFHEWKNNTLNFLKSFDYLHGCARSILEARGVFQKIFSGCCNFLKLTMVFLFLIFFYLFLYMNTFKAYTIYLKARRTI